LKKKITLSIFIFVKKIFYLLFFSKKYFLPPSKKKILIFDAIESNQIIKYTKKSRTEALDFRFLELKNSKVNIYILLKLIFLKLSIKNFMQNYCELYINEVRPSIIITLADNYELFYKLKPQAFSYKKIMVQRSLRTLQPTDILCNLSMLKKKNYNVDYILSFNKKIGFLFKKFLKGKVMSIGSFRSNFFKKLKKRKNIELMYVSVWRSEEPAKKEDYVLFRNIQKYCLENNIKLTILGCKIALANQEEKFYRKIFKNIKYEFLQKTLNRDTYRIVDACKILISVDSTLGYESASRGNKVCFFCIRGNRFPYESLKFGWPLNFKSRGKFWTNSKSYLEFERIINCVKSIRVKDYKKIIHKIINFDEENKTFNNLIKDII